MNQKPVTDKDLMVYLVSIGHEIKRIKKEGNHSIAYFENTLELSNSLIRFANKADTVNVADYTATERRIKTLLCMQKIS